MSGNLISGFKSVLFIVFLTALHAISWAQQDIIDTTAKPIPANVPKEDTPKIKTQTQNPVNQKKFSLPARVLEIYNAKYPDSAAERHRQASIGDIIVVRVANLDSLINRSQCKDVAGNVINGCQQQKIGLFINGRLITNIFPLSGAPQKLGNTDTWELQYQLERNGDNNEIWANILGSPPLDRDRFFVEPVTISVGLQNEYAIETANTAGSNNFNFIRIHRDWFWACFAGIILYIALLVLLTKRGLLSDRSIDLRSVGIDKNKNPPYSLARFQMAFWFSLFVMSFLFIWLITDAYDIITSTVLALIGISAGTSLSALVIDNNKKQELLTKTLSLQKQLKDPALSAAQLSQVQADYDFNIELLKPPSSSGFFADLLNDANGISFHRLQMLVWTIVLGLIFIYSVWKKLSMPDFNSTLLALQGLTSGTYLGFKFPERQS